VLQLLYKRTYLNSILAVTALFLLIIWLIKTFVPQYLANTDEAETIFPPSQNIIISNDGTLGLFIPFKANPQLWNMVTKQPLLQIIQTKDQVSQPDFAVFSDNNRFLATIYGNTFGVWDLSKPRQDFYFGMPSDIQFFCLNNNGNIAVVAMKNNLIQAIDLFNRQLVGSYRAFSKITAMSCDQNAQRILIGTDEKKTILWSAANNGTVLHEWTLPDPTSFALISPQGNYSLISAGPYSSFVWNNNSFEKVLSLHRRNQFFRFAYKELLMITGATISNDEATMAVVTPSGLIQLWDLNKHALDKQWSYTRSRGWPPKANFGIRASYNPKADTVITVSNNGKVNYWQDN
jgi:WD40 repeat protein